jgi:hypothetical protein
MVAGVPACGRIGRRTPAQRAERCMIERQPGRRTEPHHRHRSGKRTPNGRRRAAMIVASDKPIHGCRHLLLRSDVSLAFADGTILA